MIKSQCTSYLMFTLALLLVGSILILQVYYYFVTRTLVIKNSRLRANQVFGTIAGEHTFVQETTRGLLEHEPQSSRNLTDCFIIHLLQQENLQLRPY